MIEGKKPFIKFGRFKSPDFNKLPSDEKQKAEVREEATNIQR